MNLVLITPLRDEAENIAPLYKSIANLDTEIHTWIIVENDSTDGSKEILAELPKPSNVLNLIILNESLGGDYALGFKYSAVVKRGMDEAIENRIDFDFIGILDADCFPEPDYYNILLHKMMEDQEVGIISGIINENGKKTFDSNHARGGCRIWRRECFNEAGYLITMSADSVSEVLARLKGWKTVAVRGATVHSRELGNRVNFQYYGRSVYYRGFSITYVILKTALIFIRTNRKNAFKYFQGFYKSYINKDPQIEHLEVRKYYNRFIQHKLLHKFRLN